MGKSSKANNNKLEETNTSIKRKRTNNKNSIEDEKQKKLSKHDTSELMNRLEDFSSIWNDCPDVDNDVYSPHLYERKGYKNEVNNGVDQFRESYNSYSNNANINSEENYNETKKLNKKSFDTKDTTTTENKDILRNKSINNKNNSSELSDLKRKKAAIEHRQVYVDQQKLIKQALSSKDGERANKKIIFSDDNFEEKEHLGNNFTKKENSADKSRQLFEEENDDEMETNFKINPQFEGKKGRKLLQLQSKYASDSRFMLDTRFCESGSEASENETPPTENQSDEKEKQLAILGSIVNREIKPLSAIKSFSKQKDHRWMVRFDPTREDHKQYILQQNVTSTNEKSIENKKEKKKGKEQKKRDKANSKLENKEEDKNKASDEKFYSVKEDLKEVLNTDKKTQFSLLQLFGPKETQVSNTETEESIKQKNLKYKTKNPFKYDSSDSESEEENKQASKQFEDKNNVSQSETPSTWRTTFFLSENDSRLQEALEFLKAPEDQEDDKEFAEKRKILKVFIKNKFKNNYRKNGLFKKKLGGLKRKTASKNKFKKR